MRWESPWLLLLLLLVPLAIVATVMSTGLTCARPLYSWMISRR